jgi:hypothetical protein
VEGKKTVQRDWLMEAAIQNDGVFLFFFIQL